MNLGLSVSRVVVREDYFSTEMKLGNGRIYTGHNQCRLRLPCAQLKLTIVKTQSEKNSKSYILIEILFLSYSTQPWAGVKLCSVEDS